MEEAIKIFQYLPISFRNEVEQNYIDFLWEVFAENYENEKYHFSFLAFHMLYMCFVYFEVWQIKSNQSNDFSNALVGFNKDLEIEMLSGSSPFAFWKMNEKNIFRFLKLIGMNNTEIGMCAKIVEDRNYVAHSNGNIYYKTQADIDLKIGEILRCMEIIQDHSKLSIRRCYGRFLAESSDPEDREFTDDEDQIREMFVYKNYLSLRDIQSAKEFDFDELLELGKNENVINLNIKLNTMYPDEDTN